VTGPATDVPLERRVLTLWRMRAALALFAVVALVVAASAGAGAPLPGLAAALVLGLGGGLAIRWWTAVVWASWRFEIGPGALRLRHGVLTRRESTVPFHRVQHIDLAAGPLERRLGLTTLVLRTASATSDSTIPGIDAGDAEGLRTRILALVGTDDGPGDGT